jgi:hypothetical protein
MTSPLAKIFAIIAALLLAGTEPPLRAYDNPRTPISREAILGALHSSGMQIRPDQMEQLSGMTANEPNPLLKILSVEMLDGEADKVLLRCEHSNTCLPFYVLVHWGKPGDPSGTRFTQSSGRMTQPALPRENTMVRSGRTATLMLEGEYIHMTLPVLCLQNGGRGQQVRVISKDTKRRYVAWVVAPGVVTSMLSD